MNKVLNIAIRRAERGYAYEGYKFTGFGLSIFDV